VTDPAGAPRPRVSDERLLELVERRNLGPGISHNEVADLIDDQVACRAALAEERARREAAEAALVTRDENTVAIEGFGIPWAEVDLEMQYTGDCVAEKLRRGQQVHADEVAALRTRLEAAERERDEWKGWSDKKGRVLQESIGIAVSRAEAAEAQVTRLRAALLKVMRFRTDVIVGHQSAQRSGMDDLERLRRENENNPDFAVWREADAALAETASTPETPEEGSPPR
jgi:hypothetical protein